MEPESKVAPEAISAPIPDDLKPCPFCGSRAQWAVAAGGDEEAWEIQCSNTDCPLIFIGREQTGREFEAAWNTRPEAAHLIERIASLTAQVATLESEKAAAHEAGFALRQSHYDLERELALIRNLAKTAPRDAVTTVLRFLPQHIREWDIVLDRARSLSTPTKEQQGGVK